MANINLFCIVRWSSNFYLKYPGRYGSDDELYIRYIENVLKEQQIKKLKKLLSVDEGMADVMATKKESCAKSMNIECIFDMSYLKETLC